MNPTSLVITQALIDFDINQVQFAAMFNVSPSTVHRWLNTVEPSVPQRELVLAALAAHYAFALGDMKKAHSVYDMLSVRLRKAS